MPSVSKQLQSNLVAILKERGLSQMALAKLTQGEVSQAAISYICRGRMPAPDVILSLAKALEVPIWRLLVAPDSDVALRMDNHEREDARIQRLIRGFLLMQPSERDFIEQLVERTVAARKDD